MKELADYKLSKLAKEYGYNEKCDYYWNEENKLREKPLLMQLKKDEILCPQLNDLQDWFLEVYNILIDVIRIIPNEIMPDPWKVKVRITTTGEDIYEGWFEEKYKALESGLKEAFEYLEGVDLNKNYDNWNFERECLNQLKTYKKLAELFKVCEGEFIQELYFLLKEYGMNDTEYCDTDDNGNLIPTVIDCYDMNEEIIKLLKERIKKIEEL